MSIREGANLSNEGSFVNIGDNNETKAQSQVEEAVKIESSGKNYFKPTERGLEEKVEGNEQRHENFENLSNDDLSGREKSYHSSNTSNAVELTYDNNTQTSKANHQKIFTTTVMEKKKNINFKVIKNKEKEEGASSGLPSFQNFIHNNYEKNNNKNNNYFGEETNNDCRERQVFQNVILDNFNEKTKKGSQGKGVGNINNFSNVGSGFRTSQNSIFGQVNTVVNSAPMNNFYYMPSMNFSNFSSLNSIGQNMNKDNRDNTPFHTAPVSKKKIKQSETYYLEIFINAAEKIIHSGYSLENNVEDFERKESSCSMNDNFINDNKDKLLFDSERMNSSEGNVNCNNNQDKSNSLNNLGLSSSVNTNINMDTNEANEKTPIDHVKPSVPSTSQRNPISKGSFSGKCGNKNCDTHRNRKKIKIFKLRANKGKILRLCQSCVEAYNNKQYCYFCLSIYRDSNINSYVDDKGWILCDYCDSWQHIQCEEKKGNYYTNLQKLLDDNTFKYSCPHCRHKKLAERKTQSPLSKSVSGSNNLLKKKRNKNQTQNFYRKEYDFSFKYSNSRRIKEKKMKMIETMNRKNSTDKGKETGEKKTKNCSNQYDLDLVQVKKRKVTSHKNSNNSVHNGFTFMNENENSREIIQDIHKIQDKVNNLIK